MSNDLGQYLKLKKKAKKLANDIFSLEKEVSTNRLVIDTLKTQIEVTCIELKEVNDRIREMEAEVENETDA